MCVALVFGHFFSTEPAPDAVICRGIVGLTFAVLVLSARNLTDQRREARQSVLTENDSGYKQEDYYY